MESWRTIWRKGFAPEMDLPGLKALAKGLAEGDPFLIQGASVSCITDEPESRCTGGCPVTYSGTHGNPELIRTVSDGQSYFDDFCYRADVRLKEPAACRWFLNWVDDTPRDEMRRELLAEVNLAIQDREVE